MTLARYTFGSLATLTALGLAYAWWAVRAVDAATTWGAR